MTKYDETAYRSGMRRFALPFLANLNDEDLAKVTGAFPQTTGDDWWFRQVVQEEQARRKAQAKP
jgi:hypothetical protein